MMIDRVQLPITREYKACALEAWVVQLRMHASLGFKSTFDSLSPSHSPMSLVSADIVAFQYLRHDVASG